MITLPLEVARMIGFSKLHPATAWRNYYGLSEEKVAELVGCHPTEIEEFESNDSTQNQELLQRLCQLFGIVPEALTISNLKTESTDKSVKALSEILKYRRLF